LRQGIRLRIFNVGAYWGEAFSVCQGEERVCLSGKGN